MLLLGNENGEHVTIGPIGRISCDGWFQSNVEIQVNGFLGQICPYFEIDDLVRFYEQLERLYVNLDGEAELKPIEGQFNCKLSGNGKGHVLVQGTAYTYATYGSCLEFEFNVDQSYLPKLLRSIRKVIDGHASDT